MDLATVVNDLPNGTKGLSLVVSIRQVWDNMVPPKSPGRGSPRSAFLVEDKRGDAIKLTVWDPKREYQEGEILTLEGAKVEVYQGKKSLSVTGGNVITEDEAQTTAPVQGLAEDGDVRADETKVLPPATFERDRTVSDLEVMKLQSDCVKHLYSLLSGLIDDGVQIDLIRGANLVVMGLIEGKEVYKDMAEVGG